MANQNNPASFSMIAPLGSGAQSFYSSATQTTYSPTAQGLITGVQPADVLALLVAGCIMVDPSNALDLWAGLAITSNFGTLKTEGNIFRSISGAGVGNAADTTDDIIGGIALDAGAFDIAGRGLCITAQGTTGATTNNKRFKLFLNPTMSGQTVTNGLITGGHVTAGTPIVDSGTWVNGTTANSAAGWQAICQLFKYGAAGSNTQLAQGSPILGILHGGIQAAQALTLTESGIINIVVTGASYTTGAANDVLLQMFEVNAMN